MCLRLQVLQPLRLFVWLLREGPVPWPAIVDVSIGIAPRGRLGEEEIEYQTVDRRRKGGLTPRKASECRWNALEFGYCCEGCRIGE
jgi:hypothetical protein